MWPFVVALLSASPGEVATAGDGDLRWVAPAGCPDQAQMRTRIGTAGGTGGLQVEGTVVRKQPGAWSLALTLSLGDQTDTRQLRGESCEELAAAAELLIAVRRDELAATAPPATSAPEPEPVVAEPPSPPSVEPGPGPAAAPTRVTSAAPTPPRPAQSRPRRPRPTWPVGLHLGAAAGLGLGATPLPGVPVELVVGGSWRRLRVAVRGRYHLPRDVALEGGRTARIQVGTASVEACARPGVGRVELPICGQLGAGGSRADGGGGEIHDRRGAWVELGLDVGVAWHLRPWWALTARLGAAAVLRGVRYVRGDEVVFAPAPVHARAVVGMEFHIPTQIWARPENQ